MNLLEVIKVYDYGKCHVCDTPMVEKTILQDFWIKNKLIVIENIPAGVCPQCGEAYAASQGLKCLACQGEGYYEIGEQVFLQST